MRELDLNADVGEGMESDAELIPLVSSVNIACGAHAGDPDTMRKTIEVAQRHRASIGAHPGYFDRENFGRRPQQLSRQQRVDLILYQLGALDAIATAMGAEVSHLKAHGALYNQAESNGDVAMSIVEALLKWPKRLRLVGRAGSAMESAAREADLPFVPEAFADRRYLGDGSLMPRSRKGAVLEGDAASEQVRLLLDEGCVIADDGSRVRVEFKTLCIHGDSPAAVESAGWVRKELQTRGITTRPPG